MNRVVVTGLGIISPIGNTIKDYWSNLKQGKSGIDYITRFSTNNLDVKIAGEIKEFSANEFMSKIEIKSSDLFSQYALFAALQAFRDSELNNQIQEERLGVYFGSGIGGINSIESEYLGYIQQGTRLVSPYFIPKIISNSAAGHIAIRCQAKGPCLPIVTACSTSSHAIGEAYRAIKHGYADSIIAGGADAGITPLMLSGFANCGALSLKQEPKQALIPFDKRRDGFVMGEGAGAIVLEAYESARKRNAKIYAEMIGYGTTCDAYHITASNPSADSCSRAIQMSMDEIKDYDFDKIYINAHGTGTSLNDKNETLAIKKAFGKKAYDIQISSTKSMTGHMMGAAGAAEAIAAILAINTGYIPPTIGLYEKDNECDLNYTPNVTVKRTITLGLSLSMGFGGHNACLAFKTIE